MKEFVEFATPCGSLQSIRRSSVIGFGEPMDNEMTKTFKGIVILLLGNDTQRLGVNHTYQELKSILAE